MNASFTPLGIENADPEIRLLFLAARSSPDARDQAQIRGLASGDVDWRRFCALAVEHHVVPLVYHALSKTCPDVVPSSIMSELGDSFRTNLARNLALSAELANILKLYRANGINAIPFKGPTLASIAFGSLALRQSGDLDILVRGADSRRARSIVLANGYRALTELSEDEEWSLGNHFRLVRDDRQMTIELHWRLICDRLCMNLNEDSLWDSPTQAVIAGEAVSSFALPELLLYLCAHGAKHCWRRLNWVCDIAELARARADLDWDAVVRLARARGCLRLLSVGLILGRDLLGAPLPESVARLVNTDRWAHTLAQEIAESYTMAIAVPDGFAAMWRFNIRVRERLRDRFRCRLKLLAPAARPNPRDRLLVSLPPRLEFLYPVVKAIRLAVTFATKPRAAARRFGGLFGFR